MTQPTDETKLRAKVIFERYVERRDGCWGWTGTRDEKGYARFRVGGINYRAHRFALSLVKPPSDPALRACHRCDNPQCTNPEHLFWGTDSDNMQDMVAKGRGKSPFPVKLNEAAVRTIRRAAEAGRSFPSLAQEYGVTPECIGQLVRRQTWRYVA